MRIVQADERHAEELAVLAQQLWPHQTTGEWTSEISMLLKNDRQVFFMVMDNHKPVGFAHCSVRVDYVEGTHTTPVAYLEGIYVDRAFRGNGLAGKLLQYCENWAKKKGCTEFASDCSLDNVSSYIFHKKMGFSEVQKIICFTKDIS